MAEEIINRIANSNLKTIDLEDYYPEGNRIVIDIKDWLYQELILREKDFRTSVANHNWEQYRDSYIALTCTSDAIIPSWAYLLITTRLNKIAKKVIVGSLDLLETVIFDEVIQQLDITEFINKPIIIKGCANKPIPASAYTLLIGKIQPIAKSVMYGEACSTVPLYKAKK